MKKKSFFARSLESYIKLIVSVGFALLMIKLIFDGKIVYFINPNLIPLVIFCIVSLLLTAAMIFYKSSESSGSNRFKLSYLIYIIPIIIGFAVPAKVTSISTLQLAANNSAIKQSTPKNDTVIEQPRSDELDQSEPKIVRKTNVTLDEKNYAFELDRIYMFPTEYQDCQIEITGKIYINNKMKNNEFAILRPMMTCCSADAQLVGLLCSGDFDINSKKDTWVKATGKINVISTDKEQNPTIVVSNISPAQKPDNEFVYPY